MYVYLCTHDIPHVISFIKITKIKKKQTDTLNGRSSLTRDLYFCHSNSKIRNIDLPVRRVFSLVDGDGFPAEAFVRGSRDWQRSRRLLSASL